MLKKRNLFYLAVMAAAVLVTLWVALGGGGVTKLIYPGTGKIERVSNPKYPQEYLRDADKILFEKAALADFLMETKGE